MQSLMANSSNLYLDDHGHAVVTSTLPDYMNFPVAAVVAVAITILTGLICGLCLAAIGEGNGKMLSIVFFGGITLVAVILVVGLTIPAQAKGNAEKSLLKAYESYGYTLGENDQGKPTINGVEYEVKWNSWAEAKIDTNKTKVSHAYLGDSTDAASKITNIPLLTLVDSNESYNGKRPEEVRPTPELKKAETQLKKDVRQNSSEPNFFKNEDGKVQE